MIYSYPKFRDHQSSPQKSLRRIHVTSLRAGRCEVHNTPARAKDCSLPQNIQTGFRGSTSRLCKGYQGPGDKDPGA